MKQHYVIITLFIMMIITAAVVAEEQLQRTFIEVRGTVERVDVDGAVQVSIQGLTILATEAFDPAMLSDGMYVTVRGYLGSDGSIEPVSLELVIQPVDDGEGLVDADEEVCEPRVDHKQVTKIASQYHIEPLVIATMHCDGHGFGNIKKAFGVAAASQNGMTAQDLLELHSSGLEWDAIYAQAGVDKHSVKKNGKVKNKKK